MGKREDRISIVSDISIAAKEYKNELVGNSFMYVFDGRAIEVIYRVRDFAHLTGVGTSLSGTDLYKEAIRGTLKENQIYFSQRHPYDLCRQKVQWLKTLPQILTGELVILEEIHTNSIEYDFGVTECNITLCMTEDAQNMNPVNQFYIVRSLRIDNCLTKSKKVYNVDFIFRKKNDQKMYTEQLYSRASRNINQLPEKIRKKINLLAAD